ncbi:hypothetical protein N7534_010145, partial [Penicillium rubens]
APCNNVGAWVSLFCSPLQCYPIRKFLSIVLLFFYFLRHGYFMPICILFHLASFLCHYSAARKISASHTRPSM